MNTPSFWREALVALLLSAVGAIGYAAVVPWVGAGSALRWLVVGLSGAYLAMVLVHLRVRIGRLVVIGAWLLLTTALVVFDPTIGLWLLLQTAAIWLVRSLCAYERLGAALMDGALSVFALATALVTARHTHSMFLCLWSFFLVQALFVLIPRSTTPAAQRADADADDAFGQAHRMAETALRRLATRTH